MRKTLLLAGLAAALATGCSQSPTDKAADQIARAGHDRGEAIKTQADSQAKTMEQQASGLSAQAKAAGGYTGERLKVQAQALIHEADIVRRQGKAQAQSAAEAADAQAKGIHSR